MDPDATLSCITDHIQSLRTAPFCDLAEKARIGMDLADDLEDLLEFLARGGSAPDWSKGLQKIRRDRV